LQRLGGAKRERKPATVGGERERAAANLMKGSVPIWSRVFAPALRPGTGNAQRILRTACTRIIVRIIRRAASSRMVLANWQGGGETITLKLKG